MRSQVRVGFTLIELMVALAVTMFLMIILTQCFVLSLETFSGMKGLGDMQQNLRSASTILASDLAEDHFEGKRRLSDPTIFNSAYPIQAGYFAVKQGSASVNEGFDGYLIPSYRASNHVLAFTVKRKGNRPEAVFTTALHGTQPVLTQFFYPLGFTPQGNVNNAKGTAYNMRSQPNSTMTGGTLNAFPPANPPAVYTPPPSFNDATPDYATTTFTTPYVPGTVVNPNTLGFYSSQWAEVYYYLARTGSTEEPSNPASKLGTPIYSLYRAQFVMVPDGTVVNTANLAAPFPSRFTWPASAYTTFQGLSTSASVAPPGLMNLNSPLDAANSTNSRVLSLGASPIPPTDPRLVPSSGTGVSEGANSAAQTQGSTELVLPNVISFQVQVLETWLNTQSFGDIPQVGANAGYLDSSIFNSNNAATNANAVNAGYVQPASLIPFSLKAIRVTLRVWDNATRQTRQTSITQDL